MREDAGADAYADRTADIAARDKRGLPPAVAVEAVGALGPGRGTHAHAPAAAGEATENVPTVPVVQSPKGPSLQVRGSRGGKRNI